MFEPAPVGTRANDDPNRSSVKNRLSSSRKMSSLSMSKDKNAHHANTRISSRLINEIRFDLRRDDGCSCLRLSDRFKILSNHSFFLPLIYSSSKALASFRSLDASASIECTSASNAAKMLRKCWNTRLGSTFDRPIVIEILLFPREKEGSPLVTKSTKQSR